MSHLPSSPPISGRPSLTGSSRASFASTANPPSYLSATSATRTATLLGPRQFQTHEIENLSRFSDSICDDPQSEESAVALQNAPIRLLRIFAIALLHSDGIYITTFLQVMGRSLIHLTGDSDAQAQFETSAAAHALGFKVHKIKPGKFIGETRVYLGQIPVAITMVLHLERSELERVIKLIVGQLGRTPHSGDYQWAIDLLPRLMSEERAHLDSSMLCNELAQVGSATLPAHLARLSDYELEAVVAKKMAERKGDRRVLAQAAQLLFEAEESEARNGGSVRESMRERVMGPSLHEG